MSGRVILDGVLYGCDNDIAEYVRQRIPHAAEGFGKGFVALGVVRGHKLAGGVVFHNFRGNDIEMSAAFDNPRWGSRRVLRRLFSYPFVQLGCRRMTTVTPATNERAIQADLKMGFVVEGMARCAYPGDVDAIILGMLREECRWLEV